MGVREIARLAGLSGAAVSLALRDSPKISEATKRRVRRIARQAGYRPNTRIAELMAQVRAARVGPIEGCFGVISLYDHPRPWERSPHLSAIYESMQRRSQELGYRLEPVWLAAPGMTRRRICSVLDARGIEGLISFGSPDLHEEFPSELDHYAVVTVGLSIKGRIHRVTSHFYNDTMVTLERLSGLGYRNPGLVIGNYEEARSGGAHTGAYLSWRQRMRSPGRTIPILRLDGLDESRFRAWRERHQPDVVVFIHTSVVVNEFASFLRRENADVPGEFGVAAMTHLLDGTGLSGMQQNQALIGAWAVELLVSRVMHRDFGIPTTPHIEMVESRWIDGASLRRGEKPGLQFTSEKN
jgi:DNA-binding LacI/PurR family transcriptional regulator